MKKIINHLFIFILFILLFSACGRIQEVEIRDISNVKFKGIENNYASIEAGIEVFNPSHSNIKIKEIDVKLFANDIYVGRLLCDEKLLVPSRSESMINVPFRLRITNIFSGASIFLQLSRQQNIKVEVEGYVRASTTLIYKKIQFRETTYIDSFR